MDNSDTAALSNNGLTCASSAAQGCCNSGRVYVGTTEGTVRAVAPNESGRCGEAELPLTHACRELRVCTYAVSSVCGIEAKENHLLLVGSVGGELVVLQRELEVRRFQLDSAVQQIVYNRDGEFIVGDAQGYLYGVTQYEIGWKKQLTTDVSNENDVGLTYFYPAMAKPTVQAIVRARLMDVEKTLSNYILVATGQKHLVVTHCGQDTGVIQTRAPIAALVSCPVGDEDIVLASGEEGIIYRLISYRDLTPNGTVDFRFSMEIWVHVPFPVVKLLPITSSKTNSSEFAWICLGVNGEIVLYRGQELVRQWGSASFSNVKHDFPVDLTILNGDEDNVRGVIVFSDSMYIFPVDLMGQ
ncbi:hypothetical protein PsorP6_008979 [Peronosclerospora sorghi]|uniref:Uncharacterized protein n=1 Tax=Peronosclerospora sorghi TaxID=230839 RepID=A0ACC0VZM5_9STRA|nr:hypothetical protein PsorP6_008979 [Peronosclerospora sorghi]